VYITPDGPPPQLRTTLYAGVDERVPLVSGHINIPADLEPGWFRIPIGGHLSPPGRDYFITFTVDSAETLALSTGPGGFYLDGALHRDREPLDRQLDFRLKYNPIRLVLGVAMDSLPAAGVLAGFAWLFALPGWALFSGFWTAWGSRDMLSKTILATAAGMALYPILLIPPWLVGLDIGRLLAWIVPLAAAASFAWRFRLGSWKPEFGVSRGDFGTVLTAVALLAVLISRLLPLEFLSAGMWGDSYHHTLITRLMVERGGLFSSWEPYAPIVTFTYHYGFHTTAAVLSWVLRLQADRSVLWTGQVVNFLAVAALFPLVQALVNPDTEGPREGLRTWLPGLVAVVAAGLIFPMPAYYTNWGRYTQIAGQFLLAAWMIVALDLFRSGRRSWREEIPGWVLMAGLGLTHYRVLIFAVLFTAAYWLVNVRREGLLQAAASIWRAGSGAAVLFLPWFWNVFGGGLMTIIRIQLTTPADAVPAAVAAYTQLDSDLTGFLPLVVWGLLPVILVWGLARRDRTVAVFGLWSLFLVAVANPGLLGLPGSGAINNFAILIAAYFPAAVLLGAATMWVVDLARSRLPAPGGRLLPVIAVLFLAICVWGAAVQTRLIRERSHALVTDPDLEAFAWVEENLPEDAVFLVNMMTAGGGGALAGTDAGWWLPYYTQRESVLPPFLFISEKTKSPDLRTDLIDLATALETLGPADPAVLERLNAFGVTHVYLGQRQGSVNSKGVRIEIGALLDDAHFDLLYHENRVWIFAYTP
jgi:hypothetical protein